MIFVVYKDYCYKTLLIYKYSNVMEKIKIHILRKLYRHGKIGESYTPIENLKHGLPQSERDMSVINGVVKELHNEGLVLLWKKNTTVSLNPMALDKIKEIIGYYF